MSFAPMRGAPPAPHHRVADMFIGSHLSDYSEDAHMLVRLGPALSCDALWCAPSKMRTV